MIDQYEDTETTYRNDKVYLPTAAHLYRPLSYQDFAAVARDLVTRGVTTRERLVCLGASNGGLLVGNMLTGFHDLFAALVLQVPLLDMKRYSRKIGRASCRERV